MPTFLHVLAARIRAVFRSRDLEEEFDQELETHLTMAAEDKMRNGMTPEQARRAARVELGGVTQLREASRAARGFPWLSGFWLDVKLGLRMLRKSWGLTLVGGLAMTVAIGAGAVVFAVSDLFFWGTLPLDEGDRVVALQTWDDRAHRRHTTSWSDLERWSDTPQSLEDVGAFQNVERNLFTADGPAESVTIAEMTASGFQLARVAPLLGRPLLEEDARDTANPVVVIGHDVWQSQFLADPAVVGQTLRFGETVHTVVGVMPEGFKFPLNHRFWTPLRADRSDDVRTNGPFGAVFARLAPGATIEGAQAELTTLGLLAEPETDEQLRARIVPYTFAFTGDLERGEARWLIRIILFLIALLLVPPCANIAILVYARTVTRQEEFAARYALGASRGRIVAQLFIEVLVLASAAAGLALVITRLALMQARAVIRVGLTDGAPFWMDFRLSPTTVLFAAALALFAATVAGIVPALKATGGQMQSGLRALGGRSRVQLGATWTTLVVAQIALSLAVLPAAIEMGWGTLRPGIVGPGFPAERYLTARIAAEWEPADTASKNDQRAFASRFGALQTELVRRLKAEAGVLEVTVAAAVPGEEPWVDVEVDGIPLPADSIFEGNTMVRATQVDDAFFDVFEAPLLTGRGFEAGDLEPARAAVIVDRTFAQQLLGDQNPLGRRVRYVRQRGAQAPPTSEPGRWYEIVGVVADVRVNVTRGTLYHPMAPGQRHPASLVLRVGSTPATVARRLREITTALDPTLRVEEVVGLDEIYRQQAVGNNLGASSLAAVTLSVLLLSAGGMYALMSFTVNQRRREIGIRSALGAQPHRLLAGIFRRALVQLGLGAAGGILFALLLDSYLPIVEAGGMNVPGVVPGAAAFMVMIGLLAAAGPAQRGLRMELTEALRDG